MKKDMGNVEFSKRFKYYENSQYIIDNLTGFIYHCNNQEIVNLLNELNDKNDRLVEKFYKELKV